MKPLPLKSWKRTLLLLVLFIVIPQPVRAGTDDPGPSPLWVGLMTPDIPGTFCVGQKQEIEFYFSYLYFTRPGELPPPVPLVRNVDVFISTQQGTVNQDYFEYPWIEMNAIYKGTFTYTAGTTEGEDTIDIIVTMGKSEATLSITFTIEECSASLQFNQSTTLSYGPVRVINNYFGGGFLSADSNGQISGSGVQSIWGDVPPYSAEGATCTHTPPWEGSSSITFSGQLGDQGNSQVIMEMEALSINASTLTCTGEGSGGMPFPGYTYSACQVLLKDFNFEATTLEVPFDCPGEAPYIVPITIIPRREP